MLLFSPWLAAAPLFDAHMHYNADDAAHYSPQQIIEKLDQSGVRQAAVTSTPPRLARQLHQHAPDRILPLLGVYRNAEEKLHWSQDAGLPVRIEAQLKQGGWRGIGELHIFAKDRQSPVFRRIVQLAAEYKLPLLLHTDPAVIDTVYDINPGQPVIWAHAGTFPYPDLLADYLQRYPTLFADLSVRDERIAPNGEILDTWYDLFATYPDRFMIGVDTYSLSRWHEYTSVAEQIRQWTDQLPEEVAQSLLYENAATLFSGSGHGQR
jgi:predicted TIM-barrel fold metal-dependent hydrolase